MQNNTYIEMARSENNHFWYRGRRKIVQSIISKLSLQANARILEVGCGSGGNLDMLSKFGIVDAFESNDFAREIAQQRSKGKINIVQGSCPHLIPFQDKKYDLICMFDVLEHIKEDEETLIKLNDMLTDRGFLLLTVPAYQWMFARDDVLLQHFRRYCKVELINKLKNSGYNLRKISSFNMFLFPIIFTIRYVDNFFKKPIYNAHNIPNFIFNAFLYFIFSSERYLIMFFNLPFGVSIFCVSQKNLGFSKLTN